MSVVPCSMWGILADRGLLGKICQHILGATEEVPDTLVGRPLVVRPGGPVGVAPVPIALIPKPDDHDLWEPPKLAGSQVIDMPTGFDPAMARAPGVIEPAFLDLGRIAGAAKLTSKGRRADAARAAEIAPILPAEQTLSVSSDPARDGEAAHSEESPSLEP